MGNTPIELYSTERRETGAVSPVAEAMLFLVVFAGSSSGSGASIENLRMSAGSIGELEKHRDQAAYP